MKYLLGFIFCIPLSAHSAINNKCEEVFHLQMKLAAHASNYANANSTRTPEGGAYKYKTLECNKDCQIVEKSNFVLKYVPGHPDANEDGYVQYPQIDLEKERTYIQSYAKALGAIAKTCKSEAEVINEGNTLIVNYKKGDVRRDIFTFNQDSKIDSWVRDGTNQAKSN